MNVKNIHKLADLILEQPEYNGHGLGDMTGFTMDRERHPCGAPGCIAGFCYELFNTGMGGESALVEALGIEWQESEELFAPGNEWADAKRRVSLCNTSRKLTP